MPKLKAMSEEQIRKALPELQGWRFSRNALRCEFKFETFKKALGFVARVGLLAEAADHHPDIDIRYRDVRLSLSTHDVGGVSKRDFSLAQAIDQKSVRRKSV